MTSKPVVAYLRVSTRHQGQDGLGIAAQRAAVAQLCRSNGVELLKEFVEVESGRKSTRPMLREALTYAKRAGAALCVAKLDRLSRNVAFLSALMESAVDFVCCDLPDASRLTLHVMVAVAENEAVAVSDRTTRALASAKAKGTLLGTASPNSALNRQHDRRIDGAVKSAQLRRAEAIDAYAQLAPYVMELRSQGMALHAIAKRLNREKFTTRTGKPFTAVQVSRIVERVEVLR